MSEYKVEELLNKLKNDDSWEKDEQMRIGISEGLKMIVKYL